MEKINFYEKNLSILQKVNPELIRKINELNSEDSSLKSSIQDGNFSQLSINWSRQNIKPNANFIIAGIGEHILVFSNQGAKISAILELNLQNIKQTLENFDFTAILQNTKILTSQQEFSEFLTTDFNTTDFIIFPIALEEGREIIETYKRIFYYNKGCFNFMPRLLVIGETDGESSQTKIVQNIYRQFSTKAQTHVNMTPCMLDKQLAFKQLKKDNPNFSGNINDLYKPFISSIIAEKFKQDTYDIFINLFNATISPAILKTLNSFDIISAIYIGKLPRHKEDIENLQLYKVICTSDEQLIEELEKYEIYDTILVKSKSDEKDNELLREIMTHIYMQFFNFLNTKLCKFYWDKFDMIVDEQHELFQLGEKLKNTGKAPSLMNFIHMAKTENINCNITKKLIYMRVLAETASRSMLQ